MPGITVDDRGQTAFDFAVGMGVFLITVGFVLTFVPGVFAPFTVGSGTDEIVSDRVAATLAEDVLVADLGTRATLDERCTVSLFDGDDTDTGCRFDDTETFGDIVGIEDRTLNVTLRQDGDVASIDGTPLAHGPTPPDEGDVSAAQRVVLIDDELYRLIVKVW